MVEIDFRPRAAIRLQEMDHQAWLGFNNGGIASQRGPAVLLFVASDWARVAAAWTRAVDLKGWLISVF